ncbi:biotin/lipoyl-containing protein [Nigerium massiliense]|uniref:biotin/lipoyl-containing protein n=1 Tax=Nigerium massiliense TaxID=1522317 RepID=UPI00058B9D65|nr:acetyl-CoA carboxylase biotin carboxyl carrier protein subunit [Nigerium massiliense]
MRRYTISVNNVQKVVDVEAVGANLFRVQIDGRLVDVTLDDHRDLAHSAITPAVTPRPTATRGATAASAPEAAASAPLAPSGEGPTKPTAPASAGSAPAASGAPAGAGGGRDKMTAPMPGVILTVDAAVGQSVTRGESLMVLEAMKMKNELKAPKDGVIAEVYVSAGQQVKYGETLVRFEA